MPVLQAAWTVVEVLLLLTPPLIPRVVELTKVPVLSVVPIGTVNEVELHDELKHPVPMSLNLLFTTFSVLEGSKYPPADIAHR